jgi:hypothetical protein
MLCPGIVQFIGVGCDLPESIYEIANADPSAKIVLVALSCVLGG